MKRVASARHIYLREDSTCFRVGFKDQDGLQRPARLLKISRGKFRRAQNITALSQLSVLRFGSDFSDSIFRDYPEYRH